MNPPDGTKPLPGLVQIHCTMLILINEILLHSPDSNFIASTQATLLPQLPELK